MLVVLMEKSVSAARVGLGHALGDEPEVGFVDAVRRREQRVEEQRGDQEDDDSGLHEALHAGILAQRRCHSTP
jgi:hypothetical protein